MTYKDPEVQKRAKREWARKKRSKVPQGSTNVELIEPFVEPGVWMVGGTDGVGAGGGGAGWGRVAYPSSPPEGTPLFWTTTHFRTPISNGIYSFEG